MGLEPTETGGATGVFWPLPSHKSFTQQRSVGWKKMSHWASSRTHQVCYCVGWEQDSCAKGSATWLKCHQSCGSTSLQPALLRDHCGQWKGRKDFSRECGWQKSNPSCWEHIRCVKNSETSFPWSEELGWVISAGGRRAAELSRTPPHAQRCLWQQLSRIGIATLLPLWVNYSVPAICFQWDVINRKNNKKLRE